MKTRDRDLWDQKAGDWHIQVDNKGDSNRRFNSDPFLWKFLGDVAGRIILDAGCGSGYLSRELSGKGAIVRAIDFSPKMIELAKRLDPKGMYLEDSVSRLTKIGDESIDKIVSNYV